MLYVYTGNGQFKNKEENAAISFDLQKNGITYLKVNAYTSLPAVEVPSSGGFAVYDGKGNVVNLSKVGNNHTVVLPEGGMIVFGGNAGDVFQINLSAK